MKAGCGKTARPVWAADGGSREGNPRTSSDPTTRKGLLRARPAGETHVAESVEPRVGTKGKADQQSTCRTQSRESVSQALERIRKVASERFAVTHPRWEPYAGKPHVRIYAGGVR
jgi:hypothetical protein